MVMWDKVQRGNSAKSWKKNNKDKKMEEARRFKSDKRRET